ncbi:MAG: hypothetical protein RLZZ210_735 [Pseudomonadota bacterium]|jgi:phosphoglycerol transferase MdoB-like AlkP superfamily enzyme
MLNIKNILKSKLNDNKIFAVIISSFLALNLLVRIGLLIFNQDFSLLSPQYLLPIIIIGAVFDIAVALYWIIPFVLFNYLSPKKAQPFVLGLLLLSAIITWVFIGASEFVFWNEFSYRFNFIAVDYLIYTKEVLGNITQSYNLTPILAGIFAISLLFFAVTWKFIKPNLAINNLNNVNYKPKGIVKKITSFVSWCGLAAFGYLIIPAGLKEFCANNQAVQLAGNGHFEFGHAFFHNQIDYHQFYATLKNPSEHLSFNRNPTLASLDKNKLNGDNPNNQNNPIVHKISSEKNNINANINSKMNVVLISVESLSADFMGTFGNKQNITPNLDKLSQESLLFTNLYATGTRTVRGLEALSLSIPPTPGHSIVKRPSNENLFSMGKVMQDNGYESMYIYGGYSYFDNMQHFFSNNSYKVLDRSLIDKKDIHYENIWGVADEDLFTLSLKELDTRYHANKPFFAHIMTTSNHRPFTYPNGRVDIPSKTNREGAVKYTDWAIGNFIDRAKQKPWFNNTIFVIVADHCASARGKTDLPVDKFHIPLIMYSPAYIKPQKIDYVASQIDIAPTVLNLLNISYASKFFGQDILGQGKTNQRAFMANYQTVGMYKDNKVVELRPQRMWHIVDANSGAVLQKGQLNKSDKNNVSDDTSNLPDMVKEAIGYYQSASEGFSKGWIKNSNSVNK